MLQRRSDVWVVTPANLGGLREALKSIFDLPNVRVINVLPEPKRTVTYLKGDEWLQEECGPDYYVIYEYEEPNG